MRRAPVAVYNYIRCECGQGHFYKDYHSDLICTFCSMVLDDRFNKLYIPPENWQKPDNSDFGDEDDVDASRYGMPYKGTLYSDKLGVEEPKRPPANPNIFRGRYPRLQFCSKTGKPFFARELIRIDPVTKKRDYLCIICLEMGMRKRSWHYLQRGKPPGYFEQGVLTAIKRVSEKLALIGLNPPSISDLVDFAERNYKIGNYNYSNVRDAVNQYEKRDVIRTVNDPITGSRRILMLAKPPDLRVVEEPCDDIEWDYQPWFVASYDVESESYKPPISFEPRIHVACLVLYKPSVTAPLQVVCRS